MGEGGRDGHRWGHRWGRRGQRQGVGLAQQHASVLPKCCCTSTAGACDLNTCPAYIPVYSRSQKPFPPPYSCSWPAPPHAIHPGPSNQPTHPPAPTRLGLQPLGTNPSPPSLADLHLAMPPISPLRLLVSLGRLLAFPLLRRSSVIPPSPPRPLQLPLPPLAAQQVLAGVPLALLKLEG